MDYFSTFFVPHNPAEKVGFGTPRSTSTALGSSYPGQAFRAGIRLNTPWKLYGGMFGEFSSGIAAKQRMRIVRRRGPMGQTDLA
jgi:hypothetical protein